MDGIQEAKRLFNETWDLLDKQGRTPAENAQMLHKAHTSCYLWQGAENPVNNARGEWQVSRVYSVLGFGEPALLHGSRSLELCLENGIEALDLAFGYEAVARAYSVLGNHEKAEEYKALGVTSCEGIDQDEDKTYAMGELEGIG